MGTNFYWLYEAPMLPTGELAPIDDSHPVVHIGKRYGSGNGQTGFIFAQPLHVIRDTCGKNKNDWVVVDEYGNKCTGLFFLGMLEHCTPLRFEQIGTVFS